MCVTLTPLFTNATTPIASTVHQIGLTYKDFEKTAPNLSLKLLELKDTKNNGSSSSSSQETEILSLDLSKTEMKTGSYGYSSAGKRIMIEVEVDGKKKKVPALVSSVIVSSRRKESESTVADADNNRFRSTLLSSGRRRRHRTERVRRYLNKQNIVPQESCQAASEWLHFLSTGVTVVMYCSLALVLQRMADSGNYVDCARFSASSTWPRWPRKACRCWRSSSFISRRRTFLVDVFVRYLRWS